MFEIVLTVFNTQLENVHWVHASPQEYVISVALSGSGYDVLLVIKIESAFSIVLTSDILLEFLAFLPYPERLIKAIVHSIESIVITTISSTRVKAVSFVFFTGVILMI